MAESARDCMEKVDIKPILAKPGDEWSSTDRAKIAFWLATERMPEYLMIGWMSLHNRQDAEDAFQEFCIEKIIGKGFPKFEPCAGNADAYILQAWRFHLTSYRRRRVRRAGKEQQMPVDEQGKPLIEAVDGELPVPDLVDLRLRLEFLSDEERKVIDQRFPDKGRRRKSFKTIAAEMGETVREVMKIYERAMRTLRKPAAGENHETAVTEIVPSDEKTP